MELDITHTLDIMFYILIYLFLLGKIGGAKFENSSGSQL
jgi:hypothetical protein